MTDPDTILFEAEETMTKAVDYLKHELRGVRTGRATPALVEYLKANPEANVEILGYADAATGSHAVNLKISKLRAESVAAALKKAGIASSRISAEGRGDTAQPFPGVEKNRVSICIAK